MIRLSLVRDLGWFLPAPKVLAVLQAAIDKSQDTYSRGLTTVAGYVAPLAEWEKVESLWLEALSDFRLTHFHLSGLERELGREKADLCLKRFISIIRRSRLCGVGAAVFNNDWHQSDWGGMQTERLHSPYAQCLELAFEGLAWRLPSELSGKNIGIVCCRDEKIKSIEGIFERTREKCPRLNGIGIYGCKEQWPLQVADLGAGLLRKSWRDIAFDPECKSLFGSFPVGSDNRLISSVWSLRQGAIIQRLSKIGLEEPNGG